MSRYCCRGINVTGRRVEVAVVCKQMMGKIGAYIYDARYTMYAYAVKDWLAECARELNDAYS